MLLVFVFRRISPGVVLSVLGFTGWSLSILDIFPSIASNPALELNLVRIIVMSKVVAALGMIMLALEDQLALNKAAQERERRARRELEAYTNLILSRRRVEDFDRQGPEICQTVVAHSRFAQAALLLQSSGQYRLAGAAGLDKATTAALSKLAARIPVEGFLAPGSAPSAVEQSQTLSLDLTPWLSPGDDLKRLRFTAVLAVPMRGRSATEGALLLAGMRPAEGQPPGLSQDQLRADDLLPIEMLTARLQATRSQTMMLEKLIDSEKFAGLGQLAGNVTQQLNNPLTVIMGYASLLHETSALEPQDRKGVESILTEARRMRSTLESLSRISRPQNDQLTTVSVAELLADMEELHRPEFLHRSIEFRLSIAPALPKVVCHAQQLRHAVLHCLQFAIEAVDNPNSAPGSASVSGADQPGPFVSKPAAKEAWCRFSWPTPAPAFSIPNAPSTPSFPPRPPGRQPAWASASAPPFSATIMAAPRQSIWNLAAPPSSSNCRLPRIRRIALMAFTEQYDVAVVGAGHAGCEAAMAAARMGLKTALITMNLDLIAQMSCNPAVGGVAKGHLVREVDALGGIMGEVADAVGIQFRLLNTSRGPAVWSPRAQCDKQLYRVKMREVLESQPGLHIRQAEVVDLVIEEAGPDPALVLEEPDRNTPACPPSTPRAGPEAARRPPPAGRGHHHHHRHLSEWPDPLRRGALSGGPQR